MTVPVPVTLNVLTAGTLVAGTQNTITFSGGVGAVVTIGAKANGKPDCAVNDAINKGGTSFAFQPAGCTGGTCTAVKALVLALDNVCPICGTSTTDCPGLPACPVTMYTCNVVVAAGAGSMDYPLTQSDAGASDPNGNALTVSTTDGKVTVGGGGGPTPTPGGTSPAEISVGSTSGTIGETGLSIPVMVNTGVAGTEIAGTQNTITFSGGIGAAVSIAAKSNGKPDCTVNSAINKGGTSFAFQPAGCTGEMCTAVKALVLALDNVCPICGTSTSDCPGLPACPVTMYTCNVTINSTAAGNMSYPLTCTDAGASDPSGGSLTTSCTNGAIMVTGGGGGTATPTPTTGGATPTPTHAGGSTPTPTHTGGGATPTRTKHVFPTSGFPRQDDDACAIASPSNSSSGWMLLLPAAVLLWYRRRSR
jgi:hypothetical protein